MEIIQAIGEDPNREGLQGTPRRIAEMYCELLSGMDVDPMDDLATGFDEAHQDIVIFKDIPFFALCEHHFLPFFGTVNVGYIPNDRIVGVSKIARAVDTLAKRPQMQERLTAQMADAVMKALGPKGVGVIVQAEHLCMTMRGVKKPGSSIVTSATRGSFGEDPATKAEFMSLFRGS
ncbi:MAG: cyclohydrolase [Dehalococcoidia bacterium]|nr:cyclohydrolase [Dehalococcoidia bacterium]